MKKYVAFTFALLLGIHAPLFASTEVLKGSPKDISKKTSQPLSHTNAQLVFNKMSSCGTGFKVHERGIASWYGPGFHGKPMANTKPYDMWKDTVAHPTLKFGTIVCIANISNGKTVLATVTDRGPYVHPRIIDVSKALAIKLDFTGTAKVVVSVYRG